MPTPNRTAAYRPLQRELPNLHQSGAIKFAVALRMARAARRGRRQMQADAARYPAMATVTSRLDRVREDMRSLRIKIAQDRAFHSVDNVPDAVFERIRVEAYGHAWFEAAPILTSPVAVELKAAA